MFRTMVIDLSPLLLKWPTQRKRMPTTSSSPSAYILSTTHSKDVRFPWITLYFRKTVRFYKVLYALPPQTPNIIIKTIDVVVVIMIMIIIIMYSFIKNENRLRYHMLCVCVCVRVCVRACVFLFVLMCRRPHFKIILNELRDFHARRHGRYAIRGYITNVSCFDLLQTAQTWRKTKF